MVDMQCKLEEEEEMCRLVLLSLPPFCLGSLVYYQASR